MSTTVSLPVDLETALTAIDPARLFTLTERLCAPDVAGRRVGTQGHARASAFLAEQLRGPDTIDDHTLNWWFSSLAPHVLYTALDRGRLCTKGRRRKSSHGRII